MCLKPEEGKPEGQLNKYSSSGNTGMLMSFSVAAEGRTRTVYATACKGSVDYEGRISQ